MINSLTTRIFAIFWLTIALVLMLVLMVLKLESRQMTPIHDRKQHHGVMLQQNVSDNNLIVWWRRLFRSIAPGQWFILVKSEGRVVGAQSKEMQIIRNFICQYDNADHPQKKKYGCVEMVGPFAIHDGEDNYKLYQIYPTGSVQYNFTNLLFDHPILLLIVTMLISIPLLLWLAGSLTKMARTLKHAADEVARGNLRQHPELEAGPQEFLSTGVSFNQMVCALERMVTVQQRLLSDISHELRTPLTRLQLATALVRRRYGQGYELARIEMETQRLDSMINDLLVLSRNRHQNELAREVLKANDLWIDVLKDAQFEAEQMGKILEIINPPVNWTLLGNHSALDSALENVIRNALCYSYQRILVGFSTDQQGIIITVDDDGPGVSEDDREHIFRPFYRTNDALDRESGGTGLGLAIVETAVMQHCGWVKAEDSQIGGLRIIIWLPLLAQH